MAGRRFFCAIAFVLGLAATTPVAAQFVEGQAIASREAGDYTALRLRPLFSPDRAPPIPFAAPAETVMIVPEPPPQPPPPAASAPDWKLVGLVRSNRVNSAMFKADGAEAFSLRMGESRDGWTLTEIGRFEVTLDSGDGRASVSFPTMP